jgi:DNA-binding transcriptional LysR family regulator
MKPSLNQIEAFCWIARIGSFHAAAAQLHLTQPTVSLRIQDLEKALGCRLFSREGGRARLTPEGTQLLPQAERMVALAEQISIRAGVSDPLHGKLRLGAPDSVGMTCLPAILGAVRRRFPALEVSITISNSTILRTRLNERMLDAAFLVEPQLGPHIRVLPIVALTHVWVASPRLRLPRRRLQPNDLVQQNVLMNPEPSSLATMVRTWFATAGLELSHVTTCDSLPTIVRLVVAGEGVSLLPTIMLGNGESGRDIRLFGTRPPIAPPHLFAAFQIDKFGPVLTVVVDTVRQILSKPHPIAAFRAL